ncbi:MAG: hypothetical protein AB1297_09280, partial [bacterium]
MKKIQNSKEKIQNYNLKFKIIFFFLLSAGIGFCDIGLIKIDGVINPITARFVRNSLAKAEQKNLSLVIIKIDTPGGLVTSTHEIVKELLNSKIPVCSYIFPKGARAASAKVCVCVGEIKKNGKIEIIGIGTKPCSGLHRGMVSNISQT